jgi:hypothetical protein
VLTLMLLLVQGDWKLEHQPVLPPPWVCDDATVGPDSMLLARGQSDAGMAVFAVIPGEPAVLLANANGQLIGPAIALEDKTDGGQRVLALATQPQPRLVELGRYEEPSSATCSADGEVCAIAHGTLVEIIAHGKSRALEVEYPCTLSMKPDGSWLALRSGTLLYLERIAKPALWLVAPEVTWQVKDVADAQRRLEKREMSRPRGASAIEDVCSTELTAWEEGDTASVLLDNAPRGVGDPECTERVMSFSLSLKNFSRSPLPYGKWTTESCPSGGWTNPRGALTMQCAARGPGPRALPGPQLPQTMVLDDNTLFIDAVEHTSFTYLPKGIKKGLPVMLEGPSVVTFGTRSVTVQPVDWPTGLRLDGTLLDDDWHSSLLGEHLELWRFTH